jgi:murein DD-endopeptidase MepM/ murein hydrolase activator NlpD
MTVEGSELVVPGTVPLLVRAPNVDPVPVAVADGALVAVEDGELRPVEGVPDLAGLSVTDPAKGPASYAVLAQNATRLLHVVPGAPGSPEVLLEGTDLTAPSIDSRSWIWSTSAVSDGTVSAARPGTGTADVEAPWLTGRRVSSLRLSGDATRALVTSTAADGQAFVDLAGVIRDEEGRPEALVPAHSLMPMLAEAREAVWAGESVIAVLGTAAGQTSREVWASEVMGPVGPALALPVGGAPADDIAAGSDERAMVLATADGRLWQRAGSQWLEVPSDAFVADPAFAG